MSLILEALRKSESERRLGSAPDLLAAMPVMRASAPRRRWPLVMAGGLLLLVALASIGWWLQNASTPRAATSTSSPHGAAQVDAGANAVNGVHRDALQASLDARTPRLASPGASATTEPARAIQTHSAAAPVAAPPAPVANAIEPVSPGVASNAATPIPAPVVPMASAPAAEPAMLTLADLSADERNALPALKVSMHVYADESAHRFMIIDGQRVAEGARLADGVVLVRIRRDGAEIDVRGRRLLLPKP